MEKLSKEQEYYIYDERVAEHQQEEQDGIYSNWLSDHIKDLRSDFIEEQEAEFDRFCRDCFDEMELDK